VLGFTSNRGNFYPSLVSRVVPARYHLIRLPAAASELVLALAGSGPASSPAGTGRGSSAPPAATSWRRPRRAAAPSSPDSPCPPGA